MGENTKEEKCKGSKEYYFLIKKIFKWVILSIIMGIPIGIVVGLFNRVLSSLLHRNVLFNRLKRRF